MDPDKLVGGKLGNYEIVKLLGKGAMGVVYLGRDPALGRLAAIKVLPQKLANDAQFLKRFQLEASLAGRLDHPNIVTIYGIGSQDEFHYFAMQHIEGTDLEAILEKGRRLDIPRAVEFARQIADGLEAAHELNIIHRDIKPSNVMVDARGRVKILDFGVARLSTGGAQLTSAGVPVGTLLYMSPEQCRGEELDRRSDIFNLTVVLYRMLTGRLPFTGTNMPEIIMKIVATEAIPVESLNPKVPASLAAIVAKGMAKDRNQRYSSCAEMLDDLERFVSGAPVAGGATTAPRAATMAPRAATMAAPPSPTEVAGYTGGVEAEDEDPLARAVALFSGTTGLVKPDEAKQLFPQAASSGNPAAKMWMAILHNQGLCGFKREPQLAQMIAATVIDDVITRAEDGDLEAAFVLAEACYFGLGVERDYPLAIHWYQTAAEQGHALAMNSLGYMYYSGEGMRRDYSEALRWYGEAARRGHAQAMNSLGYIHANGEGVATNLREATQWWKESARRGFAEAQDELKRRGISWQ